MIRADSQWLWYGPDPLGLRRGEFHGCRHMAGEENTYSEGHAAERDEHRFEPPGFGFAGKERGQEPGFICDTIDVSHNPSPIWLAGRGEGAGEAPLGLCLRV